MGQAIRYNYLSTEKLIQLSQNQALPQASIVQAMVLRLAATTEIEIDEL